MWLWGLDVGKADYGVVPKFRINERMAHKDRLLLAARYQSGPPMNGLGIWGASEYFLWSPSAIGFVINNIVLISLSSDFLVSRHLKKLDIKRFMHDSGDFDADAVLAAEPGMRLEFFAATFIVGQVILPMELFTKLGLEMANRSPMHSGWGEGPILKLNGKLEDSGGTLGSVELFSGNRDGHLILMELYLEKATKYLLDDFLACDFTKISSQESREAIQGMARQFLAQTDVEIHRSRVRYHQLTGLKLSV